MSKLTPEQRRERLSAGGRKGGATRAKSFTSEYQKRIRARRAPASLVAGGRKGAFVRAVKRGNPVVVAAMQMRAWEKDKQQYCSHCEMFQPARQVERAETCIFVCEICGNAIELPF
jgi:hypothetical protein